MPVTGLADDRSGKVEFKSKRGEHIEFWFDRGVGAGNIRVFTVWNNYVLAHTRKKSPTATPSAPWSHLLPGSDRK